MTNQWIYSPLTPEQEKIQNELTEKLKINPSLIRLLVQRGIATYDDAYHFFVPDLNRLHDPFLIKDMDIAIERLNKAFRNKEKVLVYGDYDVDGTTAVSLVYNFLKKVTSDLGYYIPDRYDEGYGISTKGIDYAEENGFSLVIALDCGIKANNEIDYANSKGIDFIICDHHTTGDALPKALAVLDSKRADDTYPYKELSGCGVGFKLMQAFAISNGIDQDYVYDLLDLVAVSIASDIVPITGENRILAHFGLQKLNNNPSIGLKSIIKIADISRPIEISDIVFKIGPRINASGRIRSGMEVVELLTTKDKEFAQSHSTNINDYNETRRNIDKTTTEEAKAMISEKYVTTHSSIVVYHDTWQKGIVGIVASRLTEEYYKPSIVLAKSNGLITGSARSVPGFDLYSAIDSCSDLLDSFGGHMYAAGLSLKEENLNEFKERFEKYVAENIGKDQLQPKIDIDAEITFEDITDKFINTLKRFAPFGPGNMKPIFLTKNVFDYKDKSRIVGKEGDHLKLDLYDQGNGRIMSGIAFRMKNFIDPLKNNIPLDICYTLEDNTFKNKTTTQLMVVDMKEA